MAVQRDEQGFLYDRFAREAVAAALEDTPVVAINGPRQAGKSTFVAELLGRDLEVVTLDDPVERAAAQRDPTSYVEDRPRTLVIDEVQRVPELLLAIKASVDRRRTPGRFILTGSTRLLTTPQLSESLAGRIELVDLWPFSQGELGDRREQFVDIAFGAPGTLRIDSELTRRDYMERVCRGGFPEAVRRAGSRRDQWFENYATTVVQRSVRDIAHVDRADAFPTLVRLCAARTAQELNVRSIATDLGVPYRTVGTYMAHLQTVFLTHHIPAWSRNLTSKVVHRPKLMMIDSGLAAHQLGVNPDSLRDDGPAGQLLETFVALEIRKQLGWSRTRPALFHFRDRDGAEVDVVLEARSGHVVGCEIKASATVRAEDFRGLRLLQDRLGSRFVNGFVLYTGRNYVPFGERLAAVPISTLWQA